MVYFRIMYIFKMFRYLKNTLFSYVHHNYLQFPNYNGTKILFVKQQNMRSCKLSVNTKVNIWFFITPVKWSGYWNNSVPQIFSYFNYLIVLEKNRGELDVLDHVFLFNGILGLYEKPFCSLGKVWSLSTSILYAVYVRVLYIIEIIKSVLLL